MHRDAVDMNDILKCVACWGVICQIFWLSLMFLYIILRKAYASTYI